MKKEEIKTLNLQIFGLVASGITLLFSILLTYNQKLKLEKKKTILNAVNTLTLSYITRILTVAIAILFLYVNYKLYDLSKKENEDLKSYTLQIIASYLSIISALIALYVVTLSNSETVSDVENPII